MATLSKIKVTTPVPAQKKFDLSGSHITTADFMQLNPVYYRHMVPGERISVNAQAFTRLAPLAVPTFGRARLNLRAFFVPFRVVMPHFNEFITDTLASNSLSTSLISKTPFIPNQSFVDLFLTNEYSTSVQSSQAWDFFTGSTYYRLTNKGRRAYKLFHSLGYRWNWFKSDNVEFSALPLLCYVKVYLDWYAASAYQDTDGYQKLCQLLEKDDVSSSSIFYQYSDLDAVCSFVFNVVYDGDNNVFVTAWDNPVSPNNGLSSSFAFKDISRLGQGDSFTSAPAAVSGGDSTPQLTTADTLITQYGLDALKSLSDYVMRHSLVGARAIDRYLSEFGINLAAEKLRRSVYIGFNSIDINIGDVMQTVNTATGDDPSNLGDYAGQGHGGGQKTWEFETDEFGLFLVCASILPNAGYVQGFDRNLLHLNKTDFFTHEFDNLGCQAIATGELYQSLGNSFKSSLKVFGFAPRYYEYKVGRDFLTGDAELHSFSGGDSWHLFRLFTDSSYDSDHPSFSSEGDIVHSLSFVRGSDAEQYNRIFNNTNPDADKFNLIYQFNVASFMNARTLFDTYDFEENGKQLTLDAGGTKVN